MDRSVRKGIRRGVGSALALAATLAASLTLAQTPPDGLTLTTVDPPRGEAATAYQQAARGRAETQASYATDVQGGRLTVDSRPARAPASLPRGPVLDGNIAMLVVVGGLALALFLWLRFGGGGLLARTPATAPPPLVTPDGWNAQGDDTQGGDLLARAAAMNDRRAALVLLLRACLLHAAQATQTRLARSDTERRVLARLPGHFAPRALLADLLRRTELAHYGGRAVSEADFEAGLNAARHVLGVGAAHG
jgi:hypothetical protein